MADFLLELYSEEIPPLLQINARNELRSLLEKHFKDEGINFKSLKTFSSPTRLVVIVNGISEKIKILSKEVKGPKVGVDENILYKFLNSHNAERDEVFEKKLDKGTFYFLKTKPNEILTKDLLIEILPKSLNEINWKKSMRWSSSGLMWGRPLRSILSIFNNKILEFEFYHLKSSNIVVSEIDLTLKSKQIKTIKEYLSFLKSNEILLDHDERKRKILDKFKKICKSKNYKDIFNLKLIEEVTNIVENPNILLADFNKDYLSIPSEIIISTLQTNQRYFPLFDTKDRLTNFFLVVVNKADKNNLIKEGNKRVVEARLSDARFFWEKDKSKNLIKQIAKLKDITFYEKIGTIYDKTQRLRKLSSSMSDELNINKEKVEIAASVCKSDLSSDLVGEYPELQGLMGRHFALAQGFENEVANSISEHYLPTGISSPIPKKPISYSISIVDKLDSLVGFFLINEKPTSSKDPFALRRAAIGLLRIIIENKLNIKLKDLITMSVGLYKDQGVEIKNSNIEKDLLSFLKERMRNILKEKKIQNDIIEASISSHMGDNYLNLFKKSFLMNKYIKKEIGKNVLHSYKRVFNILNNEKNEATGKPDAVLFRKDEEKNLFDKINEIRRAFTVKDEDKNYENLLIQLSGLKSYTDNFFDNVVVNDENHDIKNNRLELLKMFCKTFNNFIDFSKLEGA